MPAIKFDITADNSNVVNVINETTEHFAELADTMHDINGGEFVSLENDMHNLVAKISEYKGNIEDLTDKLAELAEAQRQAAIEGDADKVREIGMEMAELGRQIDEDVVELERLQSAYDSLNITEEKQDSILVKMLGGQENYNKIISGMPPMLRNAAAGIEGMTKAGKAFIATPLGAILGALILAYKAITTWLNKSAEGQQVLAKISGYLSGALAGLTQIVMNVGKALYKAFTDPKEAVKGLWQFIKDQFVNRIEALGGIAVNVGKIIYSAFSFNFDEAKQGLKELGDNMLKLGTGIEPQAIKDTINGVRDIAKAESDLNVRRNKLHRERTAWMTEEAEYDRQIAEQRNLMRVGSNEERAKAAAKMQDLINEKTAKEIAMAKEEYEIKKASNALTDSSQEDLDEEERLRARITQLETQGLTAKGMAMRIEDSMNKQAVSGANQLYQIEERRLELRKQLKEMSDDVAEADASLKVQAMRDGFDKELAELDFEHEQRLTKIRKQYQDTLDNIEKLQKEEYKKRHGSYNGFAFNPNDEQAKDALHIATSQTDNENRAYQLSRLKLAFDNEYKSLISSAEDYESKRIAITSEASEKIEELKKKEALLNDMLLEAESDEDAERIEEEIIRNKRAQELINSNTQKSLEKLDDSYSDFYRRLAKDRTKWLVGDTVKLLTDAEAELAKFGDETDITDADKLEKIQRLKREVDNLKRELSQTFTPSGILKALLMPDENGKDVGFSERIKSIKDAWVKMTAEQKWQTIGGYVSKIGSGLGRAADYMRQISELTGDTGLGDTADKLGSIAQNFQAAGEGAASGGWIGAIVGGVSDILNQTLEAFENVDLQEAKAAKTAREWARALEMAFLEIDKAKFDTVFGEKSISFAQENFEKAIRAASMYQQKLHDLNEEYSNQNVDKYVKGHPGTYTGEYLALYEAMKKGYSGLQMMLVKTKDHTGWANFWGVLDEFSSLGELAPELWDENGELLVENAEKFLSVNEQITAEQREQIQQLVDLKKGYDEAMKEVDDSISDTFGNLSSDLSEVIWDSVMTGSDAWERFREIGAEAISDLGKKLISQMLITEYLEQYRDQMRSAYQSQSPEETQSKLRGIVADIFGGMQNMLDAGSLVAEEYKAWAEQHGFDLTQLNAETQNATAGGFQTMSQDTASELNGRFTALQLSNELISQNARSGVELLLAVGNGIESGNAVLVEIRNFHMIESGLLDDIAKYTKPLLTFGDKLDKIESNTSKL